MTNVGEWRTGLATGDPAPLPKVTPSLLRRAGVMCPRRLREEMEGATRADDPVNRARMREAFLSAVRDVHAELRCPQLAHFEGLGRDLEPEERAVLHQAARWYVELFGDRPAVLHEHGLDQPTVSRRRGVRIGGWVDLAVVGADGSYELRQFELWGGRVPDDALDLESVRLAVLRLARLVGGRDLQVSWADLVHGHLRERRVRPTDVGELRHWFDGRLAEVREVAAHPAAVNGPDCLQCGVVAGCPEHGPWHGRARGRRGDVRPPILRVSPTALAAWHRCPREWRNLLLAVPASDPPGPTAHGDRSHAFLKLIHEEGSCRERDLVDDVLARHGAASDEPLRAAIERHAEQCPAGARALGHEITRARFQSRGRPFMASARIDALWAHDGLLDARDYKTGGSWDHELADDVQARVQAFVLEPLARSLGLRLRIRFEYLAPEVATQPAPFEPEPEDVAAIRDELQATVVAMHAETAFAGVADPDVCRHCRFRSICPDSAAPSEPAWPVVEGGGERATAPTRRVAR